MQINPRLSGGSGNRGRFGRAAAQITNHPRCLIRRHQRMSRRRGVEVQDQIIQRRKPLLHRVELGPQLRRQRLAVGNVRLRGVDDAGEIFDLLSPWPAP